MNSMSKEAKLFFNTLEFPHHDGDGFYYCPCCERGVEKRDIVTASYRQGERWRILTEDTGFTVIFCCEGCKEAVLRRLQRENPGEEFAFFPLAKTLALVQKIRAGIKAEGENGTAKRVIQEVRDKRRAYHRGWRKRLVSAM